MTRFALFLLSASLLLGQQNPTLQQYLTTRQASIAQVYSSIAGSQMTVPAFGAERSASSRQRTR
jgi:hypothetical protein